MAGTRYVSRYSLGLSAVGNLFALAAYTMKVLLLHTAYTHCR